MMKKPSGSRATQMPTPVIVLGVEHPRGVAVVQSLGRMGVPVIGVDHDRGAPGMNSRFIKEKIFVDECHDSALRALESFTDRMGTDRQVALLIATNDHYLTLVSQNFEWLSRRFILTTPPWEVVSRLMDKRLCYALARSIGLNFPRFFAPSSVEDIDRVFAGLDFQNHDYIFTKPSPTGEPTDSSTNRFTRVAGVNAQTALARYREIVERTGDLPMISEVVPGQSNTCIGVSLVLDRNHDAVAAYCVKRLQLRPYKKDEGFIHPYELGANVYCESTHDDEAVDAAIRLLRAVGYYGAATVEFRRDATNGILRLVKVDPRFVRATSLSAALRVDLPAVLFRVFTGQSVVIPKSYPDGVGWIWLSWYLATVREQGLWNTRQRPVALLRDARRIRAAAYLNNRDPIPFINDLRRWGKSLIKRRISRVKRRLFPNGRLQRATR